MIVNKYYFVLPAVNESLDEDERDNESRHDDDDEGDTKTPEDEDDDESPEDADDHGSADDDENGGDDNSPDDDQNAEDNNSSDQDLNTGDNQSPDDDDDNSDDAPGDDSHGYDNGQQQQRGVDSEHSHDQMSQAQGGESEQPADVADEGTMLSSMSMVRYSPSSAYVLNDNIYLAKVAAILKYTLEHSATKAHVHGFLEQLRQAKQGKTKIQKDFWTTPDPSIDAWMLLTGRQREAFDLAAFVRNNPTILPHVESLRKKANVLVLASRCPIAKEMERQKREREGESSQQQPEVPSQSYWTVVKNLLPW